MATLDGLVSVRSQLALGLEAYLRAFVDMTAWPWSPFLGGRSLVDVYLSPDVVKRDRLDAATIARRREADRRGEFVREDDRFERTPWGSERNRVQRAVILGRPGEGKTLLTQLTCREVAQESLSALTQRTQPVSEIAVPIWLRVEDVVVAGSVQAAVKRSTLRVVTDAVNHEYRELERRPSPTLVSAHIMAALERSSTWLFLDALDERPADRHMDPRQALRSLADSPCRLVVTGRPYACDPSELPFRSDQVSDYELAPLTADQRRSFILERWFAGDSAAGARVLALVEGQPQFRDMATNGLLLTLICATAEGHHFEPDKTRRVHLYDLTVRDMVRRAHKANPLPERSPEVEQRLLVLPRVAWILFQAHPTDKVFPYRDWHQALLNACAAEGIADGLRFAKGLTDDLTEAGFLVSPAAGTWMFLHRTFLEYLAAAAVAQQGPAAAIDVIAQHGSDASWREVSILTVGHLGLVQHRPDFAGAVVDEIVTRANGAPGDAAVVMGEAVADSGTAGVPEPTRARVQQTLLETMRNDRHVPARTRASAGTALGRLGDPRFRADAWFLPDEPLLGFVEIPAGPFTMGSKSRDPQALNIETPQHEVTLPPYFIARYPVTIAQYRTFVDDARFKPDSPILHHPPNYPAWVSWPDALAYCAWLTRRLREWNGTPEPLRRLLRRHSGRPWQVTLPSEDEWEKAARGTDGRVFPWGDTTDPNLANYCKTEIGMTSAVGCFIGGASPFGVEDLAGNVWEWTRSVKRSYPYTEGDGRERLSGDQRRVVRGGAFSLDSEDVRAACRRWWGDVDKPFGFRVVMSPFFCDP